MQTATLDKLAIFSTQISPEVKTQTQITRTEHSSDDQRLELYMDVIDMTMDNMSPTLTQPLN